MSADNDIAKARRKSISEEKIRELLLKARKGATSSFTFSKLVLILDHIGWQIAGSYGWTPMHYTFMKKEQLVDESTSHMSLSFLQHLHAKLLSAQVAELPSPGQNTTGAHVVMDVGPILEGTQDIRYFYRREWKGTEGVTITSPRGEAAEFLPDHHDVDRGEKSVVEDSSFATSGAWRWLKQVDVEADLNAALGMEKHVPAAERTRENTGTCAFCWGNYKLERGGFVLHGYRRPRWGHVVGRCLGVGYEPLEVSVKGAEDALVDLHENLERLKKHLVDLPKVESVEVKFPSGWKTIKRSDPTFDRRMEEETRKTKQFIRELEEKEIPLYEKVVASWRERPMPKQGEMQRGPGFFVDKTRA